MPINDLSGEGLYTSFHVKLVDARGKERHAFTKIGGGAITPEQLVDSFKRDRLFSRCKEINITPIEGDVFPGEFLALVDKNARPKVEELYNPKVQVGDPLRVEDFDKVGKFHVLTGSLERAKNDAALDHNADPRVLNDVSQ